MIGTLLTLLMFAGSQSAAQEVDNRLIIVNKDYPAKIETNRTQPRKIVKHILAQLNVDDLDFKIVKDRMGKDDKKRRQIKFRQRIDGVPVKYVSKILLNRKNKVKRASIFVVNKFEPVTIGEAEALEIVKRSLMDSLTASELNVVSHELKLRYETREGAAAVPIWTGTVKIDSSFSTFSLAEIEELQNYTSENIPEHLRNKIEAEKNLVGEQKGDFVVAVNANDGTTMKVIKHIQAHQEPASR